VPSFLAVAPEHLRARTPYCGLSEVFQVWEQPDDGYDARLITVCQPYALKSLNNPVLTVSPRGTGLMALHRKAPERTEAGLAGRVSEANGNHRRATHGSGWWP
jgi:hypothetical protein